jgi:hypothetical protein
MDAAEVIRHCEEIVLAAGLEDRAVTQSNFLDYADFVRDIIASWPKGHAATLPWFRAFAEQLRAMRDSLDKIVAADPMCLYKPAHHVAREFHQSQAYIRYFRAPNRTSKTQSGCYDNYCVLTGSHPYRQTSPLPASVGIVGTDFQKYAEKVYLPKYMTGEGGNPLSPAFPEGGKWFHSYNAKSYTIFLACPGCAEKGKAKSCKHQKSSIILFSDNKGPAVLAGGQYAQIQFDEQVSEEFFPEALMRIKTVPKSGIIVTETPIGGKGFWTHKILTRDATEGKTIPGTTTLLVSLHTIDQFSAGLSDPAHLRATMGLMSPAEIEARVYGRPAAFSSAGVFDYLEISKMHDECETPERGDLFFPLQDKDVSATDAVAAAMRGVSAPAFRHNPDGELAVFRRPSAGVQYILACDVAQGLLQRDFSCIDVLAMSLRDNQVHVEQVAQLHGWINPHNLASAAVKLAIWYNMALIVPERNGPGHEFIRVLKELCYWNIYQQEQNAAQAQFNMDPSLGIEVTAGNKSTLVSCLQQAVKDRITGARCIIVHSASTLDEMGTYEQRSGDSGGVRFGGISGAHDDRVSALMIGVYAARVLGVYNFAKDVSSALDRVKAKLSPEEYEIWKHIYEDDERQRRAQTENHYGDFSGSIDPFV